MANFTKFGINKTEIKNGLKTSVVVKTENPTLFKSFLGFKETNSTKAETNSFNRKTSKPNSKTNSNNKKQNKSLNNYEGQMPLMVFKPTEPPKKKKLSFNKKLTNTLQKLNVKKLNENLASVINGNISNDSVEKKKQEQNEVLYQNDVLTLKKITIQSGDRIALKFNVYPKPQLVYACKSKGFSWYYYGQCFICKPNRLNLDWVKSIREKYEKYL